MSNEITGSFIMEDKETLSFLMNCFPYQIFFYRKIVSILIPTFLFNLFRQYQNIYLLNAFQLLVEKYLMKNIIVLNPQIFNFSVKYSEYKIFFKVDDNQADSKLEKYVTGYGQSFFSNTEAVSKAWGEFFERYFLADDFKKESIIAKYADLGSRAINITYGPKYLSWQQKDVNDSLVTVDNFGTMPLAWVKARSFFNNKVKLIPAQRVFWMRQKEAQEGIHCHASSNGNGGGFSYEEALLSGMYELIERDGFMCYWLNKLAPVEIDIKTVSTPALKKNIKFLKRYKLEVHFFDITTSLNIPTVMCMVTDNSDVCDPKMTFGAAAGFTIDKLFDNSLMEAVVVQRSHWASSHDYHTDIPPLGLFRDVGFDLEGTVNRIRIWRGESMKKYLAFLFNNNKITYETFIKNFETVIFTTKKNEVAFMKQRFHNFSIKYNFGYEPYIYKVKDKLLSKIGYNVVSVIVPNLFPLYLAEHLATLDVSGMSHWYDTVECNKSEKWDGKITNFYPHPFP